MFAPLRHIACLLACALAATAHAQTKPQRIVSTNACTDQLLIRLVEPSRIVSLTYLSWDQNVTAPEARGVLATAKPNHALAEEVLTHRPDLVLSGAFSARFSNDLLKRLGYNVVLFDDETSLDAWYINIRKMGDIVGEPARAETMIADFKAQLAALQAEIPPGPKPVYAEIGVNYFLTGPGTLYNDIINAGGFRTMAEALNLQGYTPIPLEQLIRHKPDLVSTATQYANPPTLSTENLKHPLLRKMAAEAPVLNIPPRYMTCPTPEILKAVRMLVDARKQMAAKE